MSLEDDLTRVLDALRQVVGDPSAFVEPFQVIVEPETPRVSLLQILSWVRLVVPEELTARSIQQMYDKDPLFWDHPVGTAERVTEAVNWRHEIVEVKGPARLFVLENEPGLMQRALAVEADDPDWIDLVARASPHEADEAGLADLDARFVLRSEEDGAIIAACGWQNWPGDIAQMGVYVPERARGDGIAHVVAADATCRAIHAGRLPLWRSHVDNHRSIDLAKFLGYREIGSQLTIRLAETP